MKLTPINIKADTRLTQSATSSDFKVGVRAEQDSVSILIHGVIGDQWDGLDSASISAFLKEHRGKTVNVSINSVGGLAWDGVAIYNELVQHDGPVYVTIDGIAASAASIIAMAGDKIRIAANGQVMIHRAWGIAIGNTAAMADYAEFLSRLDVALAATYAARTGRSEAEMLDLMVGKVDGTTFTGEEAVDAKLADEIIPLKTRKDVSQPSENEPEDMARKQFSAEASERLKDAIAARLGTLRLDDHELSQVT